MNKEIRIHNDIAEIEKVTALAESFGDDLSLDMKTVFDITLSLDELLTNVISYAYQDDAQHEILIIFEKIKNELHIQIWDDGVAFNPLEQDEPDTELELDDMEIGGLGIHFVKNKMDDIAYERKEQKNYLKLIKKIKEQ